jgi:hypothetical protein
VFVYLLYNMLNQSVLINSDSLKYIQDRIAEQQASIDSLTNVMNGYSIFDNMDGLITFGGLVVVLSIWRYLTSFSPTHIDRYRKM